MTAHGPTERGRLGIYVALGASVGSVPLPWVPDALVRRVRGALVNDVAARHGVSLAPDAREMLADPFGPEATRSLVTRALKYVGVRVLARFGPLGALWPLHRALQTYALGYLFDRYLEVGRIERAGRIDADEARRVRMAIDGALARSLFVETAPVREPPVIDDQRDAATALVDGLLGMAAGVPARLLRRLDAAFDDLLEGSNG